MDSLYEFTHQTHIYEFWTMMVMRVVQLTVILFVNYMYELDHRS